MKPALALALLVLAACGGSADPDAEQSAANVPPAVSYDQHGSAGNLAPPAEDLVNPFSGDPGAAQQGKLLFATMNCDGCHGEGALGFVGPSLVDGRWRYGGEDGALFHSVFYGRPKGMPAYGGILADETIWQLVSYIQTEPLPDIVPTISWP